MNTNLLHDLYDCDMLHLKEAAVETDDKRAALARLIKAESELKKSYPENDSILEEYQAAEIELHKITNRKEFCKRFKVGAQLAFEMMQSVK